MTSFIDLIGQANNVSIVSSTFVYDLKSGNMTIMPI